MEAKNESVIFQAENGALELRSDAHAETIWANLDQIAQLFGRDKSVISRHIKNIFTDGELDKELVIALFATTTKHGAVEGKTQTRQVNYYNLDLILSVGYRVNSKIATKFRQWATKILKHHITEGYTINTNILEKNKAQFWQALEDLKLLTEHNQQIVATDIVSLIQHFSATFFALDRYDKQVFPTKGTETEIQTSAAALYQDLQALKAGLIKKGEAPSCLHKRKRKVI